MDPQVLAALISAGAMVGASQLGKSGASSAAKQQQQIANTLFAQRQPAWDASFNYFNQLLGGDPSAMQAAVAPEVNATNAIFGSAAQNLAQTQLARGGAYDRALRQLETQRASQLSNLYYSLRPQAATALSNMATGNLNSGLSALQGASSAQLQQSQQNAQAVQGIGSFLANLLATPGLFGGSTGPAQAGQVYKGPVPPVPSPVFKPIGPNLTDPSINSPSPYFDNGASSLFGSLLNTKSVVK